MKAKWPSWVNVSATGIFHGIHQNLPSGLNLNFLSHDMLLRRADGTTRTYENHYSLVIHELGHAAHWWSLHWTIQGCGVRMMATDTKVRETLADAVMQIAVHRKFYPEVAFDVNYNSDTTEGPWTTGHQQCLETVANMNDYIYIFGPDMWDEFNQSDTCRTAVQPIDDEVEEIPLIDIFRAAKDARNMTQWESEIIAKHPGKSTEISDYFNQIK